MIKVEYPEIDFREIEELFIEKANSLIPTDLKEIPNATKLLTELGNFPMAVASNGEKAVVINSLNTTGLIRFFTNSKIFTYEMVPNGKPEPDVYLLAAKTMGAEPKKCLVIEDSVVGATAATRAGMDVLCILPHRDIDINKQIEEFSHLKPKAIIHDLLEVMKFVK